MFDIPKVTMTMRELDLENKPALSQPKWRWYIQGLNLRTDRMSAVLLCHEAQDQTRDLVSLLIECEMAGIE